MTAQETADHANRIGDKVGEVVRAELPKDATVPESCQIVFLLSQKIAVGAMKTWFPNDRWCDLCGAFIDATTSMVLDEVKKARETN